MLIEINLKTNTGNYLKREV